MSELIDLLANNQPSTDVTKRAERLIMEAVLLGMDGVGMDEIPPLLSIDEEREEARRARRGDSTVPNATVNARSSSSPLAHNNSNTKGELAAKGALPTLLSDDFELIIDEENDGGDTFTSSPLSSALKRNESGSPIGSTCRNSSSMANGASLSGGQQREARGTAGSSSSSPTKPPRLLPPIERAGGEERSGSSVIGGHRAAASPSPTKMILNSGNGLSSSYSRPNTGAQSPQRQFLPPIIPSRVDRLTPLSPSRGQQPQPKFDTNSSVRPANAIKGDENTDPRERSALSPLFESSFSSSLFSSGGEYRPAMSPKGLRYLNVRHPVTGATALHIACDRGHFDVIELLVTSGADTNALDGIAAMEADFSKGRGILSPCGLVVGGGQNGNAVFHASAGPPNKQQEQQNKQSNDDDDESDGWPILSTKDELLGLAGRGYTPLQCLLRDARHPPTRVAVAAEKIIKGSFTIGAPPLSSPTARRRKGGSKGNTTAPREPIRGAVSPEYLRRLEEERAREEQERKQREEHERVEAERLRRANSYSSKAFYQKGFDPNVRACAGLKATALHFACEMGHLSVVPLLLETGADPNIPDEKGVTPLIFLLANNPPYPNVAGIAREIVATQGFNPNHVDASGRCALHLACQLKHYAVVSQLMAVGADPNIRDTSLKGFGNTPLHWLLASPIMAPERQQQGRAREGQAVSTGAGSRSSVNTRRPRDTSEPAGTDGMVIRSSYYPSALIKAADHIIFGCSSSGRSQLLTGTGGDWCVSLASVGASVRFNMPTAFTFSTLGSHFVLDTRNEEGRTSLHYACDLGHIEVALLLLKAGADAGAADNQGQTPLHLACPNSFPVVAALVANGGADVNALDRSKRTPIDTLQERYLAIREMVAERAKRTRGGWSVPRARQAQGQGSNGSRRGGDARRGLLRRADALFDDGQREGNDRYHPSTDPSPPKRLTLAFTPPDYADESAMDRLTDLFDRAFDLLRAEGGTKSPIGRYSLQRR